MVNNSQRVVGSEQGLLGRRVTFKSTTLVAVGKGYRGAKAEAERRAGSTAQYAGQERTAA